MKLLHWNKTRVKHLPKHFLEQKWKTRIVRTINDMDQYLVRTTRQPLDKLLDKIQLKLLKEEEERELKVQEEALNFEKQLEWIKQEELAKPSARDESPEQ